MAIGDWGVLGLEETAVNEEAELKIYKMGSAPKDRTILLYNFSSWVTGRWDGICLQWVLQYGRGTRLEPTAWAPLPPNPATEFERATLPVPEGSWVSVKDRMPTQEDGEIVGRDCNGYVHAATHTIGWSGDYQGLWYSHWAPMPADPDLEDAPKKNDDRALNPEPQETP